MPDRVGDTGSDANRRTALLVDDEPHVRRLLARWLADEGWECTQAEGAEQALALLGETSFAVVATDVNMPRQSGLWLLEQIESRYPEVAVVMLTGSSEVSKAIQALTHGAFGYLMKPIQREEYVVQLQRAWERGQLLRERREHLQTLERRVREQTVELRIAHEETIHRLLGAASCRDEETGAHIYRTGLLCEALALAAGWSAAEAEMLRFAAPMHDVGKIGIPDAILRKPGRLTPEEFEVMKQHTTIGSRMLAASKSPVLQMGEALALCHHERWDGSGYPRGLAADAIPEAARILAIVDVYDALSHNRVYRAAMPEDAVVKILLEGAGKDFDPGLVACFMSALERVRELSAQHPDVPEANEESVDSAKAERGPQAVAADVGPSRKPTAYRALVVDDEPAVRQLTARALARAGFRCDLAGNGREALDLALAEAYDLIVTDLRMPVTNGHQLAVELLAMPTRPAILVLTGVVEPRLEVDLIARGVDDVMHKPVDQSVLGVRARNLVRRRLEAQDNLQTAISQASA